MDGIVQELQVAGEGAKVLLHWGICAPHVIHQDHRVRNLVQVHAHCRLDVKADADVAAVTGLGYFQVPTQMGRNEVRSVWYSVRWGGKKEIEVNSELQKCTEQWGLKRKFKANLSLTTALEDNSWSVKGNVRFIE